MFVLLSAAVATAVKKNHGELLVMASGRIGNGSGGPWGGLVDAEKIAIASGHDQPSGLRHDFFQGGEMSLSLVNGPKPTDLAAGFNDEEQIGSHGWRLSGGTSRLR